MKTVVLAFWTFTGRAALDAFLKNVSPLYCAVKLSGPTLRGTNWRVAVNTGGVVVFPLFCAAPRAKLSRKKLTAPPKAGWGLPGCAWTVAVRLKGVPT